jgi:uroporphyrinogen decarboxylase
MKRYQPDFQQLLKLLRREKTERPVLFELFMNMPLYELVNGEKLPKDDPLSVARFTVKAFQKMGYDYATVHASDFKFAEETETLQTRSLNDGAGIVDWASFEKFRWPEPEEFDDTFLRDISKHLPEGMKLMVMGPGGILENVIALSGYENLCIMVFEEPELVQRVFDEVGVRLLRYYDQALRHDSVGLISSNDDWGFNSQTFLSPDMMRQYVFPWHRKIVDLVHKAGRPVFLHSCGNLDLVMDDIIGMGYDAKHSFEDKILPIEQAYEKYHGRIALLGGLDMNFLCTATEQAVYERTMAMLNQVGDRGGWAVGTGNSVPEYLPAKSLFAMHKAAMDFAD